MPLYATCLLNLFFLIQLNFVNLAAANEDTPSPDAVTKSFINNFVAANGSDAEENEEDSTEESSEVAESSEEKDIAHPKRVSREPAQVSSRTARVERITSDDRSQDFFKIVDGNQICYSVTNANGTSVAISCLKK